MALNNLILLFTILPSLAFPSPLPHSLSKSSSLSVENQEDFLTSPNGVFTVGFHPVGVNAYCFAIWFTKLGLNQITIVWMANRNNPVNGELSKLTLRRDGNLILTDANQFISWETNTASTSSLQLALQNNGNLVLRAKDDINILWQSFDYPTDTLLPGQPLTRNKWLISSRSQSSYYSSGFYRLFFDDDNVLRLVFDGPETSSIYWPYPWLLPNKANRSVYNDSRTAVLDSWGDFQSSDRASIQADDFGPGIQRKLTLDFDGNVRIYSLDKSRIWVSSGQAIFDPCRIHGACGPNSLCIYTHDIGRKCSCLHGFKMKNYTDWSYGCEPEFNRSCKSSEVTFLQLPNSDFYGYNIHILRNATLEECERRCLQSCECKGFQYRFNEDNGVGVYDCYLKRALRNGFSSPEYRGIIRVKLPKSLTIPANQLVTDFSLDCSTKNIKLLSRNYKKGHESARILLYFASALGGLEIICIVSVWLFLRISLRDSNRAEENYIQMAIGFRKFSYSELKKSTRNFMEVIGRGSSGIVYKGTLCDNRVAAIKRLNEANPNEEEMLAELSIIGKLNHMNLIDVWGYCVERNHRLLVYEYVDRGTLAENLNSSTIDWKKRFEIATGTAKGLAYLHEECLEWVLHCDVKPQNILLDSNYQPKVADFGLSKLLKRAGNDDSNFSRIRGTRGYMAPEWIFNLPITAKVDVYSYGIVLLELITGRNPMGVYSSRYGDQLIQTRLVKWVREKMQEVDGQSAQIQDIIDPSMERDFDMCKMKKLVNLALHCAEEDKDKRPTMNEVVDMLLQIESKE